MPLPSVTAAEPSSAPGLHNLVAFAPKLISGSVPEGDEGFRSLQRMGIRTIISVDGALPDAERARAMGMRYIHLPIGYNGMDHSRTLELARAVQIAESEGPVYVHCHHGKHRSAGAAGAVAVTLGHMNTEAAVDKLRMSGTASNYTGLYHCVTAAYPASPAELSAVADTFPEQSTTSDMVKLMVEIDDAFDQLKHIESAGWTVPKDHPDLVPTAVAGRLSDLFRFAGENPRSKSRGSDFVARLGKDQRTAADFESALAMNTINRSELSVRLSELAQSCKACHAKYRD